MGILQGLIVDIEGASALAYFEVIEIFNDRNPYPTLLGIDWAIDMNRIINLKKHKMISKKKSIHIIVPLDPAEGVRFREPLHDDDSDDNLDCIYKIIAREQDWLNPTTNGRISWECKISCTLDSDEEIEQW